MQAFFHGFILAFGLILPLGIQNLFIFTQGIVQPTFLQSLPAVVTASVCDTFLILAAVQGVSLVVAYLTWLKLILTGFGFVFLLYLGWLTWNSKTVNREGKEKSLSIKEQIIFSASVSLFNPHAILDTIGVIGTSAIGYEEHSKSLFTIACILVSWLWFFFLAILGSVLGKQKKLGQGLQFLNKASAVFIWSSAIYLAYKTVI